MSAGLEHIRQCMADFLNQHGLCAVTAWPMAPRPVQDQPIIVVSLKGCKAESACFQNYLGDRFDHSSGRWEERFGKKAVLTFGLDIYGPEKGDGGSIQKAFDRLAGALLLDAPDGLDFLEFSCGQTVRDGDSRRLMRPVEAVCTAWLCAASDAGSGFVDFVLRGVRSL